MKLRSPARLPQLFEIAEGSKVPPSLRSVGGSVVDNERMPTKLTVNEYAARVQDDIRSCPSCQPLDEDVGWIVGEAVALETLLRRNRVPERLRNRVATQLHCPSCGADEFERDQDVGIHTAWEREVIDRQDQWFIKWQPKVEQFGEFLAKYPYLGAKHSMGKRIIRSIAELPTCSVHDQIWWRGRRPDGARQFTVQDMLAPPPNLARSEGRFNHYGQVVLYLSATNLGALAEVLDRRSGESVAWLQQFQVDSLHPVLDLTGPKWWQSDKRSLLALGLEFNMRVLAPNPESPWKPEYFVPRFIADVAREVGLRGIKFQGPRHFDDNLVIFEPTNAQVTAVGSPQLFVVSRREQIGRVHEVEPWEPEHWAFKP